MPGIHGLRGISAVAVFLFHLVHIGDVSLPDTLAFIGRDFGYAVHLFFCLSAFSLMHSTKRNIGDVNWVQIYLIKRFFRIAPLFYLFIILEVARQAVSDSVEISLTDIFLNFSFAFVAVPFTGLVWSGWTIGVEIAFYIIFPVLILLIHSIRSAFALVLIAILISFFSRDGLQHQYIMAYSFENYDWSYFAFLPNLQFFCMGIFSYFLGKLLARNIKILKLIALFSLVSLIALMYFDIENYFSNIKFLLWGLTFVGVIVWQSCIPSRIVTIFSYLGERSFSIYLIHPVIIFYFKNIFLNKIQILFGFSGYISFFISTAVVGSCVMIISELTYRLIEVPAIRMSRSLMK